MLAQKLLVVVVCRIDKHRVADATVKGGLARYINHCCDPNCKTKEFFHGSDGVAHMGIYAKRDIDLGEELHYDYQVRHTAGGRATSSKAAHHSLCSFCKVPVRVSCQLLTQQVSQL